MNEVLLSVDSSTSAGSVAICRGETLLGEISLNVKKTHTDLILQNIDRLLADLDLHLNEVDAFAAVIGPGAFTGLRVGVSTIKGLAMATGRPLLGVSSLRALAMQVPFSDRPVCALLDARKKEVYTGLYRWKKGGLQSLGEEAVLPPEKLLEALQGEVLFVGEGAVVYRSLIETKLGSRAAFAPWSCNTPRAASVAALALADLRQGRTVALEHFVPTYIRLSEAEIMWAQRDAEAAIEG